MTATEDSSAFNDANLEQYEVVIFLSTTGDVLNPSEQAAFERYIQAGGGYAGIHAASDTEYDWPWYGKLVGAYFNNHPAGTPTATVKVEDPAHPSTAGIQRRWQRTDEWYNFRTNPRQPAPSSTCWRRWTRPPTPRRDGSMGNEHPIAWCQDYDGGRSWYTGMGHTEASFVDPAFLGHILGGIQTAAGVVDSDCKATLTPSFEKVALDENTSNPMELTIADDGRVFYIDRNGAVRIIKENGSVLTAGTVPVYTGQEFGLLGIALDPDFATNNWVYLYYSPTGSESDRPHLALHDVGRHAAARHGDDDPRRPDAAQRVLPRGSGRWSSTTTATSTSPRVTTRTRSTPVATRRSTSVPTAARGTPSARPPTPTASTARSSGSPRRPTVATRSPRATSSTRRPTPSRRPAPRSTPWASATRSASGSTSRTTTCSSPTTVPTPAPSAPPVGPNGRVEWNVLDEPGNYGWPYCVGNNTPYNDYNFASSTAGATFNCSAPVNDSPNNTGLTNLPPAKAAVIWQSNNASLTGTPEIGASGAPMTSGTYSYDPDLDSDRKWPAYFDSKAIWADWNNNRLFTVQMNEAGTNYTDINRFLSDLPMQRPHACSSARTAPST